MCETVSVQSAIFQPVFWLVVRYFPILLIPLIQFAICADNIKLTLFCSE